jgi:hypothetical protein
MVRNLARGLGTILIILGLVALGAAYKTMNDRRARNAQEMAGVADPELAGRFKISDMWDFERMRGMEKPLVQVGGAMVVAGAACLVLRMVLPDPAPEPKRPDAA